MPDHELNSIEGYEIISRVGSGGRGIVYRARQTTLGREVAIKVIQPELANQPDFIRRFESEAQLVARLEHLHIVPLYDYWRDPHGAYLVMRWLRGGSLSQAVAHRPFTPSQAARLLDQVAAALAKAHAAGVIHRDLKPSNILLDDEGNAYLADFGIADVRGQAASSPTAAGSPDYQAPEQARGLAATPRSDIYSLGITLYECLTGKHPFSGLAGSGRKARPPNVSLPAVPDLDPAIAQEVNAVIHRATSTRPAERFSDALEMAAAFRKALQLTEVPPPALVGSLTLREQEILLLISQGKSNREIAAALFIELSTVKWYIRQIYPKLDVRNRRQAALRARELHLLVTSGEADQVAASPTADSLLLAATANPYKGLRPFGPADAHDFFGRDGMVRELLSRLSPPALERTSASSSVPPQHTDPASRLRQRFIAVVGPSGSGKSSLVRAGLIPALARGEIPGSASWFVAQMTPGIQPFEELQTALLRVTARSGGDLLEKLTQDREGLLRAARMILPEDGSELFLLVDQFEELFTLTQEESLRQSFMDLLEAAVASPDSRLRVVITLRADYFDRPLQYARFGEILCSHMETVLPLSAHELEQAIVLPAEQAGVSCEAGLPARIIEDVHLQPGALPLLQYALTELFERREGHTLTHQAYRATGGVAGALARRAEDLYREHDAQGQNLVRQMFLRLVAVEEGQDASPATRRRVLRSELLSLATDEDLMDDIIEVYAAYRLLTLDYAPSSRQPTVEVAHEALLSEWGRLQAWLEDSREDLYQRRRLQVMVHEWLAGERDAGLLLQQTRLEQVAAWAARNDLALTSDEQAYLEASLQARQERLEEEEARRIRELETMRQLAETERLRAETQTDAANRLRRRAVYLGLAVLLTVAMAIIALAAGRQSQVNALQAQTNFSIASTQGARANERALAASTAEASALEQQRIAEEAALQARNAEALAVQQRAAAEDQSRLALARELSLAAITNLAADPQLSVLLALHAVKQTFSHDRVVLPEAESALRQSLMQLRLELVIPNPIEQACSSEIGCLDAVFHQQGGVLFSSGPENSLVAWDALNGESLFTLKQHEAPLTAVAIAAERELLATASSDGNVKIWELETGAGSIPSPLLLRSISAHSAGISDVAISPDGSQLATASLDSTVKLWDTTTGQLLGTLAGHTAAVHAVAFNPARPELFSASQDHTARIWDLRSGRERLILEGHTERLADLAASPDGNRLATASWDGTIRLWDVQDGDELLSLPGDIARTYAVAFSPDGKLLAGGGTDSVINIWDSQTGAERLALPGHVGLVHSLSFAADGRRLLSGAGDGTIRIWEVSRSGNREWLTLDGHKWVMFGVDFSPDGSTLATASWDGSVKLWDMRSGRELRTLVADDWRKTAVSFSPDGAYLATTSADDTTILWELASGEAVHTFHGHSGTVLDVSFSPDGLQVATVSESEIEPGRINVWNMQTGQLARSWIGHQNAIERVAYSPDGKLIATASKDSTVKLWSAESWRLVAELAGHTEAVNAVNFSRDGRYLGTAGYDNTARIWERSGDEYIMKAVLQGHGSAVWDIVFSPDGSLAATISFDEKVKLWDTASGLELQTLPGAGNNGRELDFSPDGTYLAATSGDGLVRLYILPIEGLIATAESRVARKLSNEECRQYLHLEQCPLD